MRALIAVLLIAACAQAVPPVPHATNPVPDQDWAGTISCDTIPEIVHVALRQRFVLSVRGGIARYDRDVLLPDSRITSGFKEHGQGEVGEGGALALAGGGESRRASYRAEYRGVLAPDGHGTLEGVQHWHFEGHSGYDRACRLDLRRQG